MAMLARTQSPNGNWRAREFGAQTPADVEQTALALLVMLGEGHTEKVGKYKTNVHAAVAWLKSRQRADGAILNVGWTKVDVVTHALAVMALSEAAGMSNLSDTKKAAQRAIGFSANSQDSLSGGFGRVHEVEPDLLTTALHAMAFKSAKVAGLEVKTETFEGIIRFLDRVEDKEGKSYRYVPEGKPSPRAALMGLVSRQFFGWKAEDLCETAEVTFKALGEPTIEGGDSDVLAVWLGTLVALHQGGGLWKEWHDTLKKSAMGTQLKEGRYKGGWTPQGAWADGGYLFSTASISLSLQIRQRFHMLLRK